MVAVPSAVLALSLLVAPQGGDEVLAHYQLRGKLAMVTRTDVAIEMAFHLRRRDRGKQAIEHIVASTLTRRAATAKNVMPTREEAREFWRRLQEQLRAAGRRPEDSAAVRNSTENEWLDDLAVQLAQQRVVHAELGLPKGEEVTADMLELWLQEQRRKAKVVDAADELPPGVAVRIEGTDVPLIDFGMLLLRTAEDDERDKFVKQVAYLATIETLARDEGVTVTPADLDAAVQRRRDDAARDPNYRGVSFENMLQAEGLTVAALRDLRVFRAHILCAKLSDARWPATALAKELADDRQGVLDRVGPQRRIGLIFVRALTEPNGLVPRDFAAARRHLEEVRARLQKEPFETVARIESEHASTKVQGGNAGWHRRHSKRLPEAVLAAAFALQPDEVSAPTEMPEGCFLVKVLGVEDVPTDGELLARLRKAKADELSERLLEQAKVELVQPAAAKAGRK